MPVHLSKPSTSTAIPIWNDARLKRMETFGISASSLLRHLECPVCLETYKPPIFLCSTGHLLCSNCSKTLNKCPQCASPMTGNRCYTVEDVVNDTFTSCNNAALGCEMKIKYSLMDKHAKICSYRDVICNEKGCLKNNIPYDKYLAHLQNDHKCGEMSLFKISKDFIEKKVTFDWGMNLIKWRDEWFLAKLWVDGTDFCMYVVHFGDHRVSPGLKCRVTIGHPRSPDLKDTIESLRSRRQTFKLCMNHFRSTEFPNYYSVKMPKTQLVSMGQEMPDDAGIEFYVKCTMSFHESLNRHKSCTIQ